MTVAGSGTAKDTYLRMDLFFFHGTGGDQYLEDGRHDPKYRG